MNPYLEFVSSFAQLVSGGKSLPLGGISPPKRSSPAPDAPRALIFSPHPDDECIIGGLALRMMREAEMRIINVAVTQGSNRQRQQPRCHELKKPVAIWALSLNKQPRTVWRKSLQKAGRSIRNIGRWWSRLFPLPSPDTSRA